MRRALNLQTTAGQGVQQRENRSYEAAFKRMRSGGHASCAAGMPCTPVPRPGAQEQLFSLDETSEGLQGSGRGVSRGRRGLPPLSRKRSEPLPAAANRNMRPRNLTWNPAAAATHTLARLQLNDGT